MSLSLSLPMSAFALLASISPGPVNIVGLSSGARYSLSKGLVFITGATLVFVILFLAIGYGFSALLVTFPDFEKWLTGAGKVPRFFTRFLMQWLNPKAWIASAASIGAYTNNGDIEF
jgi:threonine/homoserine/homoserine lactone efflux protein